MNSNAILGLLGDLYLQIATLTEQNRALTEQLAEANVPKE